MSQNILKSRNVPVWMGTPSLRLDPILDPTLMTQAPVLIKRTEDGDKSPHFSLLDIYEEFSKVFN